jgi:hypothetical protein
MEINREGLERICPGCLRGYRLNSKGLAMPILLHDQERGEIVCQGCGFVAGVSGDSDLLEQENRVEFGQQFKPSTDARADNGEGDTLQDNNAKDKKSGKGFETFMENNSHLKHLDFSAFANDYPELAADFLGLDRAWFIENWRRISSFRFFMGDAAIPCVRYTFTDEYAFQFRVYKKGSLAGLWVVDKVPLKDFEACGKSSFDCTKVRVQKIKAILGEDMIKLDDFFKAATNLAADYGIALKSDKPNIHAIFINGLCANVKSAFTLRNDWGFKVQKPLLINTMFILTLEQYSYNDILLRCKSELKIHNGLRKAVLIIGNIILDLQKMVDYA